jgi:hypothetical protein
MSKRGTVNNGWLRGENDTEYSQSQIGHFHESRVDKRPAKLSSEDT